MSSSARYSGYPQPVEGPKTPYSPTRGQNPVLRGYPLVLASRLVSSSKAVATYFWNNAGFGTIRDLSILQDHPYRFDPTVIELRKDGEDLNLPLGDSLLAPRHASSPARYYTIGDFHHLYKSGTVTPLQVVESLLSLTSQYQSPLGKYHDAWLDHHGTETRIIEAAKSSTARWAAGTPLGPLDGVPFGVKDDTSVEGYINHHGTRHDPASMSWQKVQEESVWPVRKLQEAGAIVLGRNRMHQFGSDLSGANPEQGTPTNHCNNAYYPGGSSSGAASSISAGVVPFAVGTDGGGSIRIPAMFNGVYGLKPSHSRVMSFPNMSCCVIAPMAASVQDLTIAYRTMAQPNPADTVQGLFAPSRPPPADEKRVMGICRAWWNIADPRVLEICEKAVSHFAKEKGYEIVDIDIPCLEEGQLAHALLTTVELAEMRRYDSRTMPNFWTGCNAANRLLLSVASTTPSADYLRANALRELLMRHLAFLFRRHPGLLIMTPTTPIIGWPRHGADDAYGVSDLNNSLRSIRYVWLANMTGTPSVSAPVGYVDPEQGEGQLSISLMATGEWNREEQLLQWAGEAEEYLHDTYPGGRRRPEAWLDVMSTVTARPP